MPHVHSKAKFPRGKLVLSGSQPRHKSSVRLTGLKQLHQSNGVCEKQVLGGETRLQSRAQEQAAPPGSSRGKKGSGRASALLDGWDLIACPKQALASGGSSAPQATELACRAPKRGSFPIIFIINVGIAVNHLTSCYSSVTGRGQHAGIFKQCLFNDSYLEGIPGKTSMSRVTWCQINHGY